MITIILFYIFFASFFSKEFNQRAHIYNWLKKLNCWICFFALPSLLQLYYYCLWYCRTPLSDITFSIWVQIRFTCLVHLGSYLFRWMTNQNRFEKLILFIQLTKVSFRLENTGWIFSCLGSSMCSRHICWEHICAIPKYFLWIRMAFYLHCWRHYSGCGCI